MNYDSFQKGIKYEIFIGLKDKDTYDEVFTINSFMDILSEICEKRQISFTLLKQFGGYTHNKGYTTETSLSQYRYDNDYENRYRIQLYVMICHTLLGFW